MNDEEFRHRIGALRDRMRDHMGRQTAFQQGRVENRLRAAGVGERTLDARNMAGKIGVQGGTLMVSRSATPAVGDNVGSRAPAFQGGRVQDIRAVTEVAPTGAGLGVRVRVNGVAVATVTIPDGDTEGYLSSADFGAFDVPAGAWFTFDYTSVGSTVPGGRTYVATRLDVEATKGGMKP